MQTLTSQIISVTVFTNQALITRQATISLEKGEHLLVMDKLPFELIDKSIQVSGKGNATLGNVKCETTHFQVVPDEDIKFLLDEKQRILDQIHDLEDKVNRLKKEKEFVENINKKVTTPVQETHAPELKPDDWLQMLLFYREKSEQIDNEIRQTEKQKRNIREKFEQIEAQYKQLQFNNQKSKKQVVIVLEMHEAEELTLELSYLISNAHWRPIYDLRVDSQAKKVAIHYHALISQSSTENWEDVQLRVSTAQPQISGRQPESKPWRINLQKISKNSYQYAAAEIGEIIAQQDEIDKDWMGASEEEAMHKEVEKKITLKPKPVILQTQATSVFFEIAGKHTIKSDGTESKVTILMEDFEGYFRYSSVPKLSPFAYLRAKVINQTDFPFLAGEANVFLDNHFVATSYMDLVAPSEEFWTYLGIDEAMKVEHKFIKKYEKKEGGIFAKKTKVILYEYLIKIKNFKKTEEDITIFDQLPISGNDNLKVNLIEPVYKEDTEALKKTELAYLEWFFKIKSGEEITIPFKFSVEYPQDHIVTGLD